MSLFRKDWTSREADEWTIHDTLTVIISPLIYFMIVVGGAMSLFLMPLGFVILAAAIILLLVMIRIINPKLSAVSRGYEAKQKKYIEELERKVKWEED
jgi:predicted ferric reductase